MKRIAKVVAAAAFSVVGFYGLQAAAQGMGMGRGGGYGMGYGMGPGMMSGQGWGGRMMGAYDEGWFEALKKKLAITPAQEGAWNGYVTAAKTNAKTMIDTHNNMDFDALSKMSAKEQVAFMRSMHEARIDQMGAVLDARETLLKALDDNQRKIAETALGGYGLGMGGGMMGGPGMGYGGAPCGGPGQSPQGR
jgi:hypothetical protein